MLTTFLMIKILITSFLSMFYAYLMFYNKIFPKNKKILVGSIKQNNFTYLIIKKNYLINFLKITHGLFA